MRRIAGITAVAAAFAVARGPLHLATYALPLSSDDAIELLMARHVLKGEMATILWNQPYNGTLDVYLLSLGLPFGSAHAVFRLYELICALLLVVLAGLLARRIAGEPAGWAAALFAAWGTPYMVLMAATGPPPNFLMPLVTGFPLAAALGRLGPETPRPAIRRRIAWGWGLVCGAAIWNSALAVPAYAGMAVGLFLAGMKLRRGLAFAAGLAVGGSPLVLARLIGASGAAVTTAASAVTALRPRWLWAAGLSDLARAASGLFGLGVPLVVDGPERTGLPALLSLSLGTGLLALIVWGAASRRALPLLGWGGALACAFVLSRRTGGDEVRYLYGLTVPAMALAGAGLGRAWEWRRAAAPVLALAVVSPWAYGHRRVVERWRDPAHAAQVWQVPPIGPALSTLDRARVHGVYASLQFAARLALESDERLIVSQAWNERIPGDPLRFRDEVDLDPRPAWVLSPHLSRGMPRAGGFRDLMRSVGGRWREDAPGDLVVFRGFEPPYDEARPVPIEEVSVATLEGVPLPPAVLDRDVSTSWTSPLGIARGSGLVVRARPARRLSALVVAVDVGHSPLAVPWVCEADGAMVASGPARHGLQWVNGAPRAGKQALMAIPLGDRIAGDVRLIFQDAGPRLVVSEVFLYGPDEELRPTLGGALASAALEHVRAGEWDEAARLYGEAAHLEPHRASYHAALVRARWRAAHRRWLDVESLDDGGPDLVAP